MRTKGLNDNGFSLLEVLLAAIIFVVSIAGIFATLNAVRGPVINKENQLAAAVFGKQVLEALYSQVYDTGGAYPYYNACVVGNGTVANPCQDFSLSVGIHLVSNANLPAGISWPSILVSSNNGLSYTVTCADGSNGPGCTNNTIAHEVSLNINWPSVP